MNSKLPPGPLFPTLDLREGFSSLAKESATRALTDPEIFSSLRSLSRDGHVALPCSVKLFSERGTVLMVGDFLPALLSSPHCAAIAGSRGWLEKLKTRAMQAQKNNERFFPLDDERLGKAYGLDAPLAHWARMTCPDWGHDGLDSGRRSKRVTSDDPIDQKALDVYAVAFDPNHWPGQDRKAQLDALDQTYARRDQQARDLLSQLGPWAQATTLAAAEIDAAHMASRAQERQWIKTLWNGFLREANLALAQNQAREIEDGLAPAPAKRSRGGLP
jgi:hypothetical protein